MRGAIPEGLKIGRDMNTEKISSTLEESQIMG